MKYFENGLNGLIQHVRNVQIRTEKELSEFFKNILLIFNIPIIFTHV